MMTPDDPRHGSNAGTLAHRRAGETPCDACASGTLRAKKRRQLELLRGAGPARVPLGPEAHAIIVSTNRGILARATGVNGRQLRLYETDGPDRLVHRSTRTKILSFRGSWTPVGIQRRLRALTLLGWSMQDLADRTGIYMTSLAELRRNEDIKFVRVEIAEKILAVWADLNMTPAPSTPSSRETAARAADRGWVPALGWDDIDADITPPAVPVDDTREDRVDHAVVRRVLDDGKRPRQLTNAEAAEIVRALLARGHSTTYIETNYNLKVSRYVILGDERVA